MDQKSYYVNGEGSYMGQVNGVLAAGIRLILADFLPKFVRYGLLVGLGYLVWIEIRMGMRYIYYRRQGIRIGGCYELVVVRVVKALFFQNQDFQGNLVQKYHKIRIDTSGEGDDPDLALLTYKEPGYFTRFGILLKTSKSVESFVKLEKRKPILFQKGLPVKGFDLLGFFIKNGAHEVEFGRKLFLNFLSHKTLSELHKPLRRLIRDGLDQARSRLRSSSAKKKQKIDFLNELVTPLIKRITLFMTFGERRWKHLDLVDGYQLADVVALVPILVSSSNLNLLNWTTFGLPERLGMVKGLPEAKKLSKGIEKCIKSEIEKTQKFRKKYENKDLITSKEQKEDDARAIKDSPNFLDTIIASNPKILQNPKKLEEISKVVQLFMSSMFHTNSSAITSLTFLLLHPTNSKPLKKFKSELKALDHPDSLQHPYKALIQHQYLNMAFKEAQRLVPIGAHHMKKMCKSDCEIEGKRILKGDVVHLVTAGLSTDKKFFEEPFEFRPERFGRGFGKESGAGRLPRYQFIPFSAGRRDCVGKLLGEFVVKMFVAEFFRHGLSGEVELCCGGEELRFGVGFEYGVCDPYLKFLG